MRRARSMATKGGNTSGRGKEPPEPGTPKHSLRARNTPQRQEAQERGRRSTAG